MMGRAGGPVSAPPTSLPLSASTAETGLPGFEGRWGDSAAADGAASTPHGGRGEVRRPHPSDSATLLA